ncbi:MAG: DNA cytosine methyltransferase [Acidobacteria bacterium]|nr:DNA cytosine methyltransferase [Thermoanaerobaculia bacterium]NLN12374.1 DNA cytosine methyltransferase [Acidobacteriota bacterium]MBP7812979.1 DNA cytosine methyltransferase [Thermoanaerobaculia bacterium]HQN39142.1 DNA cytosine methyltransferase [Thermoanaerobaculia bacterium]HRR12788.1 DNA cytosine methyltransferase [Thermoanaerobaculia bacterium]
MRKLISLYTGAGGLDLGFEAAGFRTAVAVEMDREAVATLRTNRDWTVLDRDIHTITSNELLGAGSLHEGEADALVGGPPCQPFSKSGYWASGDTLRLDDPRAGTLGAYLRVLRDTLPQTFLLENVPGLAYRKKSEGLDLIARTIRAINRERGTSYQLAVAKLNAADYGVPQMRERVFVIGNREGVPFTFPLPTHGVEDDPLAVHCPRATAWDALGDLEEDDRPELRVRGKWADLLPSIPEGENYLWHTERGGGLSLFGWRRRYWSFLLKLAKAQPAWTIQAQPGPAIGPFHWKNRRLSARELCRLQTMPDDYEVSGSLQSVQRQIGNAVPSALAELLARAMRSQLLGERRVSQKVTLLPLRREPVPAPEPVRPVPRRFRELEGEHQAHPGTGQGYAARRRRDSEQPTGGFSEPSLSLAWSASGRASSR